METGKIFLALHINWWSGCVKGNPEEKPWQRSRAWINGSIEHSECSERVFFHNLSLVIPNDSLGTEGVAIQG